MPELIETMNKLLDFVCSSKHFGKPDMAKNVIKLHFGLDNGKAKTLKEVAELTGKTGTRIWQIKHKVIRLLRDVRKYNLHGLSIDI